MAGVDRDPAGGAGAGGVGREEGRDRAEAGGGGVLRGPVEEAEHERGPVELAEPAAEAAV